MNPEETQKALNLVKHLSQQSESIHFLHPVDYKSLGLHDYPYIIKTPMDLSTVKSKIKQSQYTSFDDFLGDMILIWDNCRTYNLAESFIVQHAEILEKSMLRFCNQNNIVLENVIKRPKIEEHPENVPFQEKVDLSERLKIQNSKKLAAIVELIEAEFPKAITQLNDERIQLRIDALDKQTFAKVKEIAFMDKFEENTPTKKLKIEE
jgi:Bromodomain/Bromodomain extra-terminal - transcription regulation